ncbi:MAG: hypothetical protein M1833_004627 [Piccolia ochrophora]|nr:MAG: hypothetical protein M1833_004627 [Piccolia ochrophora]
MMRLLIATFLATYLSRVYGVLISFIENDPQTQRQFHAFTIDNANLGHCYEVASREYELHIYGLRDDDLVELFMDDSCQRLGIEYRCVRKRDLLFGYPDMGEETNWSNLPSVRVNNIHATRMQEHLEKAVTASSAWKEELRRIDAQLTTHAASIGPVSAFQRRRYQRERKKAQQEYERVESDATQFRAMYDNVMKARRIRDAQDRYTPPKRSTWRPDNWVLWDGTKDGWFNRKLHTDKGYQVINPNGETTHVAVRPGVPSQGNANATTNLAATEGQTPSESGARVRRRKILM